MNKLSNFQPHLTHPNWRGFKTISNLVVCKIFILLIAICISLVELNAQTELNIGGDYNASILNHPMNLNSSIVLRALPTKLYKNNSIFTIAWEPATLQNARLYTSSSPHGGANISNYTPRDSRDYTTGNIGGTPVGMLTSNAINLGLGVGVYYCVIHDPVSEATSMEFKLIIIDSSGIAKTSPSPGQVISNNQTPIFSWEGQSGVPFYHITISDTPFNIRWDDDKMIVSGLNAIYMAITPNTNIQYGSLDPSGSFAGQVSPPLVPNKSYNWIVLANYGNDPLYSADVTEPPRGFTFTSSTTIATPVLTSPVSEAIIRSNTITFSWDTIPQANTYQIFLSEERLQSGSLVVYPVWNQITTANAIELNARSILINARYIWKVIASTETGISSISADRRFHYDIPVGTLNLSITDPDGNPISFATVKADPVDASMDDIPFTVDDEGKVKKKLPIGVYNITVSKSGYESTSFTVTITNNPYHDDENDTSYHVFHSPVLPFSTSMIIGRVRSNFVNLNNVVVTATHSSGQTRTDFTSTGSHRISVASGIWTVSATKEGYTLVTPVTTSVLSGQVVTISDLQMIPNDKNISGTVGIAGGGNLAAVMVTLRQGNEIIATRQTNSAGSYSFLGVPFGEIEISFSRTGFTPPTPIVRTISAISPTNTALGLSTMIPRANIVSGNITNGTTGIVGAIVHATPMSGTPFSATTDMYGQYTLNLPTGNYTITATHPSFTPTNQHNVNLSVGQTQNEVNIVMILNQSFISGNVTSGGVSLSGVTITAGSQSTTTNAVGFYTLPVNEGSHNLVATRAGFITGNQTGVSVGSGQTVNINFALSANPATITGQVLLNGSPVPNATITGFRTVGANQTPISPVVASSSGNYTLSLSSGTYTITAEVAGIRFTPETRTVSAGSTFPGVNIVGDLNQGTLSGTITNDQGMVVPNAQITIVDRQNSANNYNTVSNISGIYSIPVTAGRSYTISATKTGFSSHTVMMPANLTHGTTSIHNLNLTGQNASISGNVRDQHGNGIHLASIRATKISDSSITNISTNPLGNFNQSLSYGAWSLNISKPGYTDINATINVESGESLPGLTYTLNTNFATLNGTVRIAPANNVPLANVLVTATSTIGHGATTTTNPAGTYTFTNLIPGSYTITYALDGYTLHTITQVLAGNTTTTRNVNLTPNSATLLATVNQPGVTLTIENTLTGAITTRTLSNGLNNIPISIIGVPVSLEFSLASFIASTSDTLVVFSTNTTTAMIINFTAATGSISGNIYELGGLSTIPGATVSIVNDSGFSQVTTTGAAGSYTLSSLPYGEFTITATHPAFFSAPITQTISSESQSITNANITMTANNVSISGVVKNQIGTGLAGIQVRAISGSIVANATSGAGGIYALSGLSPDQTYTVSTTSTALGHTNSSITVQVTTTNITGSDLTVTQAMSSISGHVHASGSAVGGANILIELTNGTTYTTTSMSTGHYSLNNILDGKYSMTITRAGFQSRDIADINVAFSTNVTQDVSLVSATPVSISGHVKCRSGNTRSSVDVRLITGSTIMNTTTDSVGAYTFTGVPPFTNSISIRTVLPSESFDNDTITINTTSTNIADGLLVIGVKNSSLSGVIYGGGTPLSGAEVRLRRVIGSSTEIIGSVTTTESGAYNFSNLYEGVYEIRVMRAGFDTHAWERITILDDSNVPKNITMIVATATVAGVIRNSVGQALENVRMSLWNGGSVAYRDTISADDGSFSFGTITAGTYELRAIKTGYNNYIQPGVTDADISLDITMTNIPNSATGTVRFLGNSVPNITVRAINAANQVSTTLTDTYGDFVLSNLSGFYRIWAEGNVDTLHIVSYWNEINIGTGLSVVSDLELVIAGSILGRVTLDDIGLAGVAIIATNVSNGRVFNSGTNRYGHFHISGLPAATYQISANIGGFNINEPFAMQTITSGQVSTEVSFTATHVGHNIAGSGINSATGMGISNVMITLTQGRNSRTTMTSPEGSFNFSNVIDGSFTLSATHPGFTSPATIPVNIVNGAMAPSPTMTMFEMVAGGNVIYGTVSDNLSYPIDDATVTISDGSTTLHTISTDANGRFSQVMTAIGTYTVVVSKSNYSPSSPQTVVLTPTATTAEVNVTLLLLPAQLSGNIHIDDAGTSFPPTSMSLTLRVAGLEVRTTDFAGVSAFSFSEIYLPVGVNTGLLEITAVYLGRTFNKNTPVLLTAGTMTLSDHTFTYIATAVNISGYLNMDDKGQSIPIVSASIELIDDSDDSVLENVIVSGSGFYQFNSIVTGSYRLSIKAIYNFETFNHESPVLTWTGEDIKYNWNFSYELSTILITIRDENSNVISGNNITISSTNLSMPITLLTNSAGIAQTTSTLYSGTYMINIQPQAINGVTWITPADFSIVIDSIGLYERQIRLPLKYDTRENATFNSTDNVSIKLKIADDYDKQVTMHFVDTHGHIGSAIMESSDGDRELVGNIAPQLRSGTISLYFRSVDEDLIYTNQNDDFITSITARGIPSVSHSSLNRTSATFSYSQAFTFEIDIKDELGDDLNSQMETEADIRWSLFDENIGSFSVDNDDPRKAIFHTPAIPEEGILVNTLTCRVVWENYTIVKTATVEIRDMRLARLDIEGPIEVNNLTNQRVNYNVTALSEDNFEMTMPLSWVDIASSFGEIASSGTGFSFMPNPNFIGRLPLEVYARDIIYDHEVRFNKSIDVYRQLLPNVPASEMYTDEECVIYLPANLITSGSARIYVNQVSVSPTQQFAIDSEVRSFVYNTAVSGSAVWNGMPDIAFNLPEITEDLKIAWWDMFFLRWAPLPDKNLTSRSENQLRSTMTGWHQYAVLTASLPLGLYDLELKPNPFTPHDTIGSNRGMQISFKASTDKSRYPRLTIKVYNLSGTLVRTIVENKPILKDRYEPGGIDTPHWDGYTNEGRLARNGRYIVHLIVEDAVEKHEYLRPVVLVK
jgi:hypothetical protein